METGFLLFLLGGMIAMFLVMWKCGSAYKMELWKIAVIAVALMPAGYYGSKIMYLIESGNWNGRSLYGAIFLVPAVMYFVAKVLKLRYGELMDVCSPAGCVMFAILKVKCRIDGCCRGRMVHFGNKESIFPSQIVECVVLLLIMAVMIYLVLKKNNVTKCYPYFMIIYGATRFILNLFRETTPWIGPLPAGNFWSLVSIIAAIIVLLYIKRSKNANC